MSHWEDFILESLHQFSDSLQFYDDQFEIFFIETLDQFVDATLYDEVLQEACLYFGEEYEGMYAFTDAFKQEYLDYEGIYGGINLAETDFEVYWKTLYDYQSEFLSYLNPYERQHFDEFSNMDFSNIEDSERLAFLEKPYGDSTYTRLYLDYLDFQINTILFYDYSYKYNSTSASTRYPHRWLKYPHKILVGNLWKRMSRMADVAKFNEVYGRSVRTCLNFNCRNWGGNYVYKRHKIYARKVATQASELAKSFSSALNMAKYMYDNRN